MVSVYGLNDTLGNITYYDSSGQSDYSFSKPYSEETAQVIDKEISKIIEKDDLVIKNIKDKRVYGRRNSLSFTNRRTTNFINEENLKIIQIIKSLTACKEEQCLSAKYY